MTTHLQHILVSALVLFVVGGCGGGGGGGSSVTLQGAPPASNPPASIQFERVTGIGLSRPYVGLVENMSSFQSFSGGVAAADYDADGDIDLYVVGGNTEPNHLYENQGDGTFIEIAASVGLDIINWGSGPAFGDIDGDGDLDLFVGAIEGNSVYLFENRLDEADAAFVDVTATSGLSLNALNTVSATFFDYDADGFPDLFLTHWGVIRQPGDDTETVWRNNGDGTFVSASIETGIAATLFESGRDWSFTPNLTDIDGDGDRDLLLASDFGESQVFVNNGDGTFTRTTDRSVIVDENGMGASVGDFDNDGDMDWFVTSIFNQDIGNRLYRNDNSGVFEDLTETAGVNDGGWGWGSCAADFDNDGHLDLFHVNGWIVDGGKDYTKIPVRFFHNNGSGDLTFTERAAVVGLVDTGQGRGVACFDADRDGDIDILITNNSSDHLVYYRNDTDLGNHYLGIKLEGAGTNTLGIGAHVTVTTAERTQVREIGGQNNFVSHDPFEAHFGLGTATVADVTVRWPDGMTSTLNAVDVDQLLTVTQESTNIRLVVVQGDGAGIYDEGDAIAIQASPAEADYYFSHWSSNNRGTFADSSAQSTTFTMPGGTVAITAHYVPGVAPSDDVSVARRWSEVLLQAIRNDFARPTVHARNLFHISAAMYDAWATFAAVEVPWLLGGTQGTTTCDLDVLSSPSEVEMAREEALSFAAYRLIRHRFAASPGASLITRDANALMGYLGYDIEDDSTDYSNGSTGALGNHIAQCYIDFGLADGANEANAYANVTYLPVNPALEPAEPGNPNILDLDRWQPLSLVEFIDQAGNPVSSEPEFLSAEWGQVVPFALSDLDLDIFPRDGFDYWVYHDPGAPPSIDGALSDNYKWNFSLVSIWSSHLDPTDGVMIDISPASVGNIPLATYPTDFLDYPNFYDTLEGGDASSGYALNPVTGQPYAPQIVPRGDYTRVLAEFWADGPASETPPGHWFVILNEVNDHPLLARQLGGIGPELGLLEWDVKAYFTMGGAMHDAAIAAWGIKGWYDYIRPISSLRAMADLGQSTDPELASYHFNGIPLEPGYVELVEVGDLLAGTGDEHAGKIKFKAWKGPDFIDDPETDVAGVDWILAEDWWPYQRPSFVTPPFAGYVSGHSTYSRAAAEVMTAFTGSEYFPGGMSGFEITADEFLVFEDGPSVDMTLQWATYRDASDQCSLSRIWGGIHPPADDIPGRLIGMEIGPDAFALAESYFDGNAP